MKQKSNYWKAVFVTAACTFLLAGMMQEKSLLQKNGKEELEEVKIEQAETEWSGAVSEPVKNTDTEEFTRSAAVEPEIVEADWSEYFHGLNGAAVIYDAFDRKYTI